MESQKQRLILNIVAVSVAVLFLVLIILNIFLISRVSSLKKAETLANNRLSSVTAQNAQVQDMINYYGQNKDKLAEEYAREELGWGKDGEYQYIKK